VPLNRTDTPIHTARGGRWFISSPAGRAIATGYIFDEERLYRVSLKFADSNRWNSLSVESARSVVRSMREQKTLNADALALADEIERWARCCERMNEGLALMGNPRGGFEAVTHGHA
jgi:hypothetical protein